MKAYRHVVVVGIDGAGAFMQPAKTPCFDRIFTSGAVTYTALASNPTISAECWGSMLLGVDPVVHKLTNEIVSTRPYPLDSPFPSLFKRIRAVLPEAELGSFCDWNPITTGIVETDQGVTHATASDTELVPLICDYIREKKPTFLFIQLDSVDGAGHRYGYGSPEHLQRIHEVDAFVGSIHDAVNEAEIADDTLFLVIADHGGTPLTPTGGHHGGWTDAEKLVTFAASGKTVRNGTIERMNIRDLAAIVLYALDIPAPEFDCSGWTAQIPQGLFAEEPTVQYRDITHLTDAAARISKEPHTSELL